MPPSLAVSRVLSDSPILSWEVPGLSAQTTGAPLSGDDQGTRPPPPGEARTESLFAYVGMGLSLLIVIAAVWILIRRRRR